MPTSQIETITMQDERAHAALRSLNNLHARETSFLTPKRWRELIDCAFAATCIRDSAALLIALDNDAVYDNVNFQWFHQRLPRFVYIDRIIVAGEHRGEGLARLMYHDLFRRMQEAGHDKVVCEVNAVPANPGSDAFHSRMGFSEMGRGPLPGGDRVVRYLTKQLE
jgi:predicted GNAT superfamily acetyltransferase